MTKRSSTPQKIMEAEIKRLNSDPDLFYWTGPCPHVESKTSGVLTEQAVTKIGDLLLIEIHDISRGLLKLLQRPPEDLVRLVCKEIYEGPHIPDVCIGAGWLRGVASGLGISLPCMLAIAGVIPIGRYKGNILDRDEMSEEPSEESPSGEMSKEA